MVSCQNNQSNVGIKNTEFLFSSGLLPLLNGPVPYQQQHVCRFNGDPAGLQLSTINLLYTVHNQVISDICRISRKRIGLLKLRLQLLYCCTVYSIHCTLDIIDLGLFFSKNYYPQFFVALNCRKDLEMYIFLRYRDF